MSQGGLEPPHRRDDRTWTQRPHPLAEDRVASLVTEPAQFLVDPLDRDVGIARQQIGDRRLVGVQLAAALRCGSGQSLRRAGRAGLLDLLEHPPDGTAADVQARAICRIEAPPLEADHDLVNHGVVHRLLHLHGQVAGSVGHALRVA